MESNILGSRSVIVDKIIQRFQKTSFEIHKDKINFISQRKTADPAIQQIHYLSHLQKSKQAVHKISNIFDPVKAQNANMLKHINQIMHRRSQSMNNLKLYKNHRVESQKKQIEKQNKILGFKIAQEKLRLLNTKNELKKQFQQYQYNRQRLRKIKDSKSTLKKLSSKQQLDSNRSKQKIKEVKTKSKSKRKIKSVNKNEQKVRLNLQV